jgi:chemotaxis protein methyltransferase CheR
MTAHTEKHTAAGHASLGSLSARDFDRIRKLAYEYCGLDIQAGKEDLVASRLGKIMRGLGIPSYSAYFDFVLADKTQQALVLMIDSLTTNHTSFFREQQHFDFLESTVFPALAERPRFDIWSAACSTGEEPYSLAFAVRDFFGDAGPQVRILATDISTRVLETAKKATYEAARFQNIPIASLQKHLLRGQGASSGIYRVKPAVRDMVAFRRFNLVEPFQGLSTQFPLILCRNVMIYFDAATQQALIERFFQQLEPGGYLFIGHSESLNRINHRFEYVKPAIYRKPGGAKHDPAKLARPTRGNAA